MKHDKPEYNGSRKCPQSEVDEQDNNLRLLLKDNLVDLAMSDNGDLVWKLTKLGKLFNEINR